MQRYSIYQHNTNNLSYSCGYFEVCTAHVTLSTGIVFVFARQTGCFSVFVEVRQAESCGYRSTRSRESHRAVSGCSGGSGERNCTSPWARGVHCVCGAGQHKIRAPAPAGREKSHRRIPAEEQSWRHASHLYWGIKIRVSHTLNENHTRTSSTIQKPHCIHQGYYIQNKADKQGNIFYKPM